MRRPNHASRFEGIAKTNLQASRASDTETLQSQVNKAGKKRLSLSGLEVLHGRQLWRRRQAPTTAVVGSKYLVPAEFIHRSTAAPRTLRHCGVRNSGDWKIDPAQRLEPRASISQAVRARLNPSPTDTCRCCDGVRSTR